MKKTFQDYWNKRIKELTKVAKRDKVTVKKFVKYNYHKTLTEYKKFQKQMYNRKSCHSFWHRECINKDIECQRCCFYFSKKECDKMTKKQQNKTLYG